MEKIKKIAILISWPREIDMFYELIKNIPEEKLVIIANNITSFEKGRKNSNELIVKHLKKKKLFFYLFSDVYKKKKFKVLLSTGETSAQKINLYSLIRFLYSFSLGLLIHKSNLYLILLKIFNRPFIADSYNCKLGMPWYPERTIADIVIKFPDGADIKKKNYPYYFLNKIFDIFFSYSDLELNLIKKKFKNKICKKIDYFRYKKLTNIKKKNSIFKKYKNFNPNKKTIYWLPTHIDNHNERDSNILLWAKKLNFLQKKYNLIVRPHPKTLLTNSRVVKLLYKLNFIVDEEYNKKIGDLIKFSNLILCDYGGTAFSTIFLQKPLVLLNLSKGSQFLKNLKTSQSLDCYLRKDLISLNSSSNEINIEKKILLALKNKYQKNLKLVKSKYFGNSIPHDTNQITKFLLKILKKK